MTTDAGIYGTYNFQYPRMTDEEVWAFLETPEAQDIYLATCGNDQIPHCTTIWVYIYEGKIYFNCFAKPLKKKVRNIMENPNVCLTAAVTPNGDGNQVYGAAITGVAKVVDDQDLIAAVQAHIRRRAEAAQAEGVRPRPTSSWAHIMRDLEHLWVEITPTKILSWDKRKRPQVLEAAGQSAK